MPGCRLSTGAPSTPDSERLSNLPRHKPYGPARSSPGAVFVSGFRNARAIPTVASITLPTPNAIIAAVIPTEKYTATAAARISSWKIPRANIHGSRITRRRSEAIFTPQVYCLPNASIKSGERWAEVVEPPNLSRQRLDIQDANRGLYLASQKTSGNPLPLWERVSGDAPYSDDERFA